MATHIFHRNDCFSKINLMTSNHCVEVQAVNFIFHLLVTTSGQIFITSLKSLNENLIFWTLQIRKMAEIVQDWKVNTTENSIDEVWLVTLDY